MKIDFNINRKRLLCLFLLVIVISKCFPQFWERNLGNPETLEYIYDIQESYDKGYILGTILIDELSPAYDEGIRSSFIYKTDINGDTLWYRNFRHDPILLYSCRDVGDGTTVALFDSWDYINESFRIFLTRIDACGNKIWCKDIFDSLGYGYAALDMHIINDRIVFCRDNYNPHLDSRCDIVMYDLDGKKLCEKPFLFQSEHPNMNSPFLKTMLPLPNNEFMMLGRVYYKANPTSPALLRSLFVKFDSEGNEEWALPFGLNDSLISINTNCENVVTIEDERYFAFSCVYSNTDPFELLVMKFNKYGYEDGFVISEIDTLFGTGTSPCFTSAMKIQNNDFLNTIEYAFSDDPNHLGHIHVKVDSTISSLIDTLQMDGFCLIPTAIRETFDGKFITGGYDLPYDEVQAYMNKISINPLSFDTMYTTPYTYDSLCTENIVYADTIYFDDCLYVGDEEFELNQTTNYPIHLYPNPTEEELTVSIVNLQRKEPLEVIIYTLTGEIKWTGTLAPGEQSKQLSVYSWAKGVYFVILRKEDEILGREKVIVM